MQRRLLWSLVLAACTTPNPDATLDQMRAAASTIDYATFALVGEFADEPAPNVRATARDDLARGAYEAVVSLTPAAPGTEESCLGGPPWTYTVEFFADSGIALTAIVDPECVDVELMSPAGLAYDWCDLEELVDAFGLDLAEVRKR